MSNGCAWDGFGNALAGSFIERQFLLALALVADGIEPLNEGTAIALLRGGFVLHRELPVCGWRVDFALTHITLPFVRVAIEVDGHAFHDASWGQMARDRRRDRELLEAGWPVIRFTGREVAATPLNCALQARRIALRMVGPQLAKAAPREQMRLAFSG